MRPDTPPTSATGLESAYYSHMGFEPAHARRVRAHYVQFFDRGPVVELGCGRGEFLGLLAERGLDVLGVDDDAGMVAAAAAGGLDVVHADVLDWVAADPPPGPFAGAFCAHLLEHLDPGAGLRLLAGVARALEPGGVLVAVVPNPACYAVLTHDFWRDPTHVRFYDLPLVEFLCVQAGLELVASGPNPADHPGPPPGFEAAPMALDGADLGPALTAALAPPAAGRGGPAVTAARRWLRRALGTDAADARLAAVVGDLARRLAQVQSGLQDLARAHRTLVWGMYEPNEVYVVARRP